MHESVMSFIAQHARLTTGGSVLEVGSYNVNGSIRPLLEPLAASYLGVDMTEGPGVDEVHNAEQLPREWSDKFGLTACCEVGEHARKPWRLVSELVRVTAPGGHVLFTMRGFDAVRGFFQYHGYPSDNWRASVDGVRAMFEDAGCDDFVHLADDPQVPGVFAIVKKPTRSTP